MANVRWLSSGDYEVNEVHGTRTENWNFQNPQHRVTLQVKYAERQAVMAQLLQLREFWPYSYEEATYPELTWFPRFRATSCVIRTDRAKYTGDLSSSEETMTYDHDSYLDVVYEPLTGDTYNPITDPTHNNAGCKDYLYVEETYEPNVQFLTTRNRQFVWLDNGEPVPRALEPAIVVRGATLTRTVHGYTFIPSQINDWLGKSHCLDYQSSLTGMGFAKGTLLFTNPVITPSFYNFGSQAASPFTFSISAKFLYQPQGWNKWYRPSTDGTDDTGGFEEIAYQDHPTVQWRPYKCANMVLFLFSASQRGLGCAVPEDELDYDCYDGGTSPVTCPENEPPPPP